MLGKSEEINLETPYEVEVKFPLSDKNSMEEKILEAGGVALYSENEIDDYYDHPCRSFHETDEAVRVRHRKHTGGTINSESEFVPVELTYKGPKIDEITKTRIEHSVHLTEDDIESISQILLSTGFKLVGTLIKSREFYNLDGISISIDTLVDIGTFIEFELIANGLDSMDESRKRILQLVEKLGLDMKDTIRASYLELHLANKL